MRLKHEHGSYSLFLLRVSGSPGKMSLTFANSEEFKGQFGLITGAANGIGLFIASELLKRGIQKLAVVDRMVALDSCRRLVAEFGKDRLMFVKCDVTIQDDMEYAFKVVFEQFGRIDIIINNAGILNDSLWEKQILVNLNGTIRGTLLGLKYMSKDEGKSGGTIVNVSSVAGIRPSAGSPIYSSISAGIIGLSAAFALPYHFSKTGVRMMTICPGLTYTKIISGASGKMLTREIGNEWLKELSADPTQKPDNVATGVINMLLNGHNGSTWICEGGKMAYEVNRPLRDEIKSG